MYLCRCVGKIFEKPIQNSRKWNEMKLILSLHRLERQNFLFGEHYFPVLYHATVLNEALDHFSNSTSSLPLMLVVWIYNLSRTAQYFSQTYVNIFLLLLFKKMIISLKFLSYDAIKICAFQKLNIVRYHFLDATVWWPYLLEIDFCFQRFPFFHYFRVTLGNLNEFLSTSCITNLSFLGTQEDGAPDSKHLIL